MSQQKNQTINCPQIKKNLKLLKCDCLRPKNANLQVSYSMIEYSANKYWGVIGSNKNRFFLIINNKNLSTI